ncbi:hypothetical protein [Pseudonocardia thermophila]|jgi:hypothetical protein|nr:hypothetical protein [Pseudonocardia thermophila]
MTTREAGIAPGRPVAQRGGIGPRIVDPVSEQERVGSVILVG